MTEKDICDMYVGAKYRGKQIEILAQLNDTTQAEIEDILKRGGVYRYARAKKTCGRQSKYSDDVLKELAKEGLTMRETAERLGMGYSTVCVRARIAEIKFVREKSRPANATRKAAGINT